MWKQLVRQPDRRVIVVTSAILVIVALAACGLLDQINKGTTTNSPNDGYLHIKQWNIKLPLSAGIKDAYYVPNTEGSTGADNQPDQMLLGLKSLDSAGCAAKDGSAPVLLFRTSPSEVDPVSGDPVTQDSTGVTIGSYFYGYSLTKSETCNSETTFENLDAALKVAAQGIVQDNTH